MNFQNSFAIFALRQTNRHVPVKAAWSEQCRIKHVSPVGRRDYNHIGVRFKTVHLYQNLVQCLLALVMTAAHTAAAFAPDGVNLIDKNNRRRVFLSLLEKVAHAAGTNTDKHFNKL